MAADILNGLSTNELKKEIQRLIEKDERALPPRAKVFAAVAKLQRFDVLPEIKRLPEINAAINEGWKELNRGLSSTKGVPAPTYARELVLGAMYPGTLSALGNGIYFAVPSISDGKFLPFFPLWSQIALKYTKGEDSGILIRAALNKDAQVADCDLLKEGLREFRNRAREAGITDIGTFAAAIGKDAYYADGIYDDTGEMVYTVLNRGMLWVQKEARLIKNN